MSTVELEILGLGGPLCNVSAERTWTIRQLKTKTYSWGAPSCIMVQFLKKLFPTKTGLSWHCCVAKQPYPKCSETLHNCEMLRVLLSLLAWLIAVYSLHMSIPSSATIWKLSLPQLSRIPSH